MPASSDLAKDNEKWTQIPHSPPATALKPPLYLQAGHHGTDNALLSTTGMDFALGPLLLGQEVAFRWRAPRSTCLDSHHRNKVCRPKRQMKTHVDGSRDVEMRPGGVKEERSNASQNGNLDRGKQLQVWYGDMVNGGTGGWREGEGWKGLLETGVEYGLYWWKITRWLFDAENETVF